jgi:hypothetical protein
MLRILGNQIMKIAKAMLTRIPHLNEVLANTLYYSIKTVSNETCCFILSHPHGRNRR